MLYWWLIFWTLLDPERHDAAADAAETVTRQARHGFCAPRRCAS
jgi:hypothetical protein